MPRTQSARPSPSAAPRRTNRISEISSGRTTSPYSRDTRWATPSSRRRTDVVVVDVADRYAAASSADDDPLLLTA